MAQQQQQQQQQRVVPINIADKTFQITYFPETQDIPTVARNFCIEQQVALGYTEANPLTTENIGACATPVANHLTRVASASAPAPAPQPAGDLYTVRVPVNGQLFEIRFRPDSEPFERVAANFCVEQQASLGFNESNPLTQENLPNCMTPIARYLQTTVVEYRQQTQAQAAQAQAAATAQQPAAIRVRVPVDDKVYEITLREGEFLADIARRFCIEQQTNLGFIPETNPLTEQNLPSCVTPITTYLQNAVTQYNNQQAQAQPQAAQPQAAQGAPQGAGLASIRVPINGKTFEISFRSGVDTVEQVATNLCVQQAEVLGVTQETLPGCVQQVGAYLVNQMGQK